MLKKRIVRMKMQAVNQGAGENIIAGYEPDIEGAVEYFYEEGINEEGIDLLIEEIGLDDFVDFVDVGGAIDLNEERDARRASVRAKKYDVVKKEVDKADAARKASKKGEYAPSYAKKETDVTDYGDDKPAAKKAPAKKPDPKPVEKKATPKPVVKKVERAVEKVKPPQPKKPASKEGLRDKIKSAYKAGVKRHRKATQPVRVFHKGMKAGAKKAVKFAKDVKKVVSEKLDYDPMDDPDFDPREAEKKRGVSGKNNPKGGKKIKDIVKESGWHRRNPEKVGTPADPDYRVLKGSGKVTDIKDSKPSTTGKASKKPPGIYKPNKEGKFVKVEERGFNFIKQFMKEKATPASDKAYLTTVAKLKAKYPGGVLASKKDFEDHKKREAAKSKSKPLNAKQIWKRDDENAVQRELDAQYGGAEKRKAGHGLGT